MHKEAAGKDRTPGKVVREKGGRRRQLESGARLPSGFASGSLERERRQATKPTGCNARTAEHLEPVGESLRIVQISHWHHRAEAIQEPDHEPSVCVRCTVVDHALGVHAYQVSREFQHAVRPERRAPALRGAA